MVKELCSFSRGGETIPRRLASIWLWSIYSTAAVCTMTEQLDKRRVSLGRGYVHGLRRGRGTRSYASRESNARDPSITPDRHRDYYRGYAWLLTGQPVRAHGYAG